MSKRVNFQAGLERTMQQISTRGPVGWQKLRSVLDLRRFVKAYNERTYPRRRGAI